MTAEEWDRLQRVAAYAAGACPSASLPFAERAGAALDAIVGELAERGWPDRVHVLFRVAGNAVQRAEAEHRRHVRHRYLWLRLSGGEDAIGEAVTDRVAAWQVAWSLDDDLWLVVWAMAQVMPGGSQADAAALAGLPVDVFKARLSRARRQCRALWVAPGETPPARKYSVVKPDGRRTKASDAVKVRRRQERRAA